MYEHCLCGSWSAEGVRYLQALFGNLTLDVIVLTMLYSTAGLGIAIVNDFKSIEGDRYFPLPGSMQRQCLYASLPVQSFRLMLAFRASI